MFNVQVDTDQYLHVLHIVFADTLIVINKFMNFFILDEWSNTKLWVVNSI